MIYGCLYHVHCFEMQATKQGMRELKNQNVFLMKTFSQVDACKQILREILIIIVPATSYYNFQCSIAFFYPQKS